MFTKSAEYYDALYEWKDYAEESRKLHERIESHFGPGERTLLDVACGTGAHHPYLKAHYIIEGLDLDEGLLAIARKREPGFTYYSGDMRLFDLGKQFDVLTCLFSSIGYVKTLDALHQTCQSFAKHVKPGGMIIIEPWFGPDEMQSRYFSSKHVERDTFQITRMSYTLVEGRLSTLNFHYLLGNADGIQHFEELHELGLFTQEEYTQALESAGFTVTYDPVGLMDRGLYVGIR